MMISSVIGRLIQAVSQVGRSHHDQEHALLDQLRKLTEHGANNRDRERAFRDAIRAYPDNRIILNALAHDLCARGCLEEAGSLFEKSLDLGPSFGAEKGMALVHAARGAWDLCLVSANRALDIAGQDEPCVGLRHGMLGRSEADMYLSEVWLLKALGQSAQRDWPRALASINEALRRRDTDPILRFHRGRILGAMGHFGDAVRELRGVISATDGAVASSWLPDVQCRHDAAEELIELSREGTVSTLGPDEHSRLTTIIQECAGQLQAPVVEVQRRVVLSDSRTPRASDNDTG